ncbi:MAG: ABC transporter permease, partial [Hyphomicrobiaceae bacterium]
MSGRADNRTGWAAVSPAVLWTVLFFVVPFVAMALSSVYPKDGTGFSLANYQQFFANESYWRAMTNSLEVTAIVTVVSVLIAYPFAWVLAFVVPERFQRLALMLAILPFWTSYVVRSYAWLLVLAEKGIVNSALVGSGLLSEPMQLANTRAATVIGFVHFFVMLLTLTIYANLK